MTGGSNFLRRHYPDQVQGDPKLRFVSISAEDAPQRPCFYVQFPLYTTAGVCQARRFNNSHTVSPTISHLFNKVLPFAAAGVTYTGTVTAVSANALTLTTESDGEVTVPLVDATTYTRGSMGGQAPDGSPLEMPGNSGDSTLSALACEGTVVDDQGRAVTIKDNNGNVLVQGTSEYAVTVEDYSTTVDAANASVSVTFSEYEVEKA